MRARIFLPALARFEPHADAGVGFEWLMTKLSDSGVASRRSSNGPLALSVEIGAPWRLSDTWSIGPVGDVSVGVFTASSLETRCTRERRTEAHALHGWLSLAVRTAVRF